MGITPLPGSRAWHCRRGRRRVPCAADSGHAADPWAVRAAVDNPPAHCPNRVGIHIIPRVAGRRQGLGRWSEEGGETGRMRCLITVRPDVVLRRPRFRHACRHRPDTPHAAGSRRPFRHAVSTGILPTTTDRPIGFWPIGFRMDRSSRHGGRVPPEGRRSCRRLKRPPDRSSPWMTSRARTPSKARPVRARPSLPAAGGAGPGGGWPISSSPTPCGASFRPATPPTWPHHRRRRPPHPLRRRCDSIRWSSWVPRGRESRGSWGIDRKSVV